MAVKSKMWTVEKVDFIEQALELYLLCFLFFFLSLSFLSCHLQLMKWVPEFIMTCTVDIEH